jgi:molybdate transport system substrate-binding protein
LVFVLIFVFSNEAAAQAPVRVLASNGVKAVLDELRTQAERTVKHPLVIETNTSAFTKQKIQSGEAFDIAILTTEVIEDLSKEGKIAGGTRAGLGRSGIGVGIRRGAPKPDIGTPESIKRTLLNAKSMTWVREGASRVHIDKMLDGLQIANDIKPKIILAPGAGQATASVADGKQEMVVTLISEILPVRGLELVGPLPAKFQNYVSFAAGISPNAKNAEAAKALIKFLTDPAVTPVFQAKGMERD